VRVNEGWAKISFRESRSLASLLLASPYPPLQEMQVRGTLSIFGAEANQTVATRVVEKVRIGS
jgi:hypothetical protein